jgi:HAD superfamily hydrolase (TIGR01509 family)
VDEQVAAMTEAVLFDNDGVLVDTETLFFETTRVAFAQLGLNLTRETWCARYLTEGMGSAEIAVSLGADANRVVGVIEERNRQYRHALKEPPPLRSHVRAVLATLHGRVKLAIVTGCGRGQLDLLHAASDLLDLYDIIVTSNDCSYSKPHPEPYLIAIRSLGVRAESCIAVEDSPRGLASAKAAGVPCIAVPTELTRVLEFPGAIAVEEELSGVLKHIRLENR